MMLFLTACGAGYRSNFCALESPIYLTLDDLQTWDRKRKEQVLIHNETGERLCGWKPAR